MHRCNNVVLSDRHHLSISRPYQVALPSLPGELRRAPHALSPGDKAFLLLLLLLSCTAAGLAQHAGQGALEEAAYDSG